MEEIAAIPANKSWIEFATTFYNTGIATKAVRQNLSHNADKIAQWLADGKTPTFISQFNHSFPIGEGFTRGTKKLQENLKTSLIILARDMNVDVGFRIKTGYPEL